MTSHSSKIAIIEAAIACGSPTRGQEYAYDELMRCGLAEAVTASMPAVSDLPSSTSTANVAGSTPVTTYPMEKRVPIEIYPPELKYLDTVMAVSRELRKNVLAAYAANEYPIIIGGDHSLAIGTLAAYGEREGAENVALIYVDAHADINTEKTSESHYIHGMDVAAAMGLCADELTAGTQKVNLLGKNMHIIGGRSIDDPEWGIMREQGVHFHSAKEVRERGIAAVLAEVVPAVADKKVHISFDVDSLDPSEFTSTGYVLEDGITFADVEAICRELLPISTSFECVEYNPTKDISGNDGRKLISFMRTIAPYFPILR